MIWQPDVEMFNKQGYLQSEGTEIYVLSKWADRSENLKVKQVTIEVKYRLSKEKVNCSHIVH